MNAKPILFFLLRFTLVFALLTVPWPGWRQVYGEYFRLLGRTCLTHPGSNALSKFTRHPPDRDGLDITIYLTGTSQVDREGSAPATWVNVGSRVIGLIPTALLVALILAPPVSCRRRARALLWGFAWIHGYIVAAVFLAICRQLQTEGMSLGVAQWSPMGKRTAEWFYQILVEHIGAQLAFAVVVWVLVTFTREDWRRWAQAIAAASKPPAIKA